MCVLECTTWSLGYLACLATLEEMVVSASAEVGISHNVIHVQISGQLVV